MDDPRVSALYEPFEDPVEDWDHPIRSRAPTRPLRSVVVCPPVVSRTRTEDIDMQVMLQDNCWHELMTDSLTACDQDCSTPIDWRHSKKYEGKLCELGCWSPAQLIRSQATNEVSAEMDTEERNFVTPIQYSLAVAVDRDRRRTERIERRIAELKKGNTP